MDIEGQMAELERERAELKAALDAEQNGAGPKEPGDAKGLEDGTGPGDDAAGTGDRAEGARASTPDLGPPPVDPEAT
jgi:hypothetical protein